MKSYTIYFKEKVCYNYIGDRFNKEKRRWETDVPCEEWNDTFTFYRLSDAKKMIKEYKDKYKGNCITKTWANGDFENLGEIKLSGNNKQFVANTKQKKKNY